MIGTDTIDRVIGQDVYDESGEKIGSASEVYLDDEVALRLDLRNGLLDGAGMDQVVVRRAGRHPYMLSRGAGPARQDAPWPSRHDTPTVRHRCAE